MILWDSPYELYIRYNLAQVHNHPSGHTKPSKADYDITKRLVEAGEILGIDVLDHIIISGQNKQRYYSLRDHDELGKSYKEIKEKEYCR